MDGAGALAGPGARLQAVEVVINPLAGSVGPEALEEVQALMAKFGLQTRVQAAEPRDLSATLREAVDRAPDLLVVLAGDGTARAACTLCGADGPLVAPLPGGTMNMLPKALYGARDWREALEESLTAGSVRMVSGGELNGHSFYVGAVIGWPALWARAREAAREHKVRLALLRAQRAYDRAFAYRLAFTLDGRPPERAQALSLFCPLVSKAMEPDATALEAVALDPRGAGDALRIGARILMHNLMGDWREDPAVHVGHCRTGRAFGRVPLPVTLDGEPMVLEKSVEIRFKSKAFRALAPAAEDPAKI